MRACVKILTLIFVLAGALVAPASAQTSVQGNSGSNPVENIMTESNGSIVIDIPQDVVDELLKEDKLTHRRSGPELKPGINRVRGWRVQVFSQGNNPHSLESRARARGNAIVQRFPKYRGQSYSFDRFPNWVTQIGNFQTKAEAEAAAAEIKRAFPQFGSEVVVKETTIVVIR